MNIKPFNNPREIKICWLRFMSSYPYICVYPHISQNNLFNISKYLCVFTLCHGSGVSCCLLKVTVSQVLKLIGPNKQNLLTVGK